MDFSYSPRTVELQQRLQAFIAEHVLPAEPRYFEEIEANTAAGKRQRNARREVQPDQESDVGEAHAEGRAE